MLEMLMAMISTVNGLANVLSSKIQVELNSLVHTSSVTQLTRPQIELNLLAQAYCPKSHNRIKS